jgi:hypothetical protein
MTARTHSVPKSLAHALRTYCNVNALDAIPHLRAFLRRAENEKEAALVRRQLADAILKQTLTPQQYEELTGQDFDSLEELTDWLRQLWRDLFENEPIR